MTPTVSVIVPTWDRLPALRRALAGLETQSFRDLEVVVVDDGSSDGTVDWLRAERPDVRLVATGGSAGAAAARNRGVEHARGELVAFLDDDDVWQPSYLEAQVANLGMSPAAILSYADHVETDPAGRRFHPDTRPLLPGTCPLVRLLAESYIHTMSVVVARREAFDRFGWFDERLAIVHDLDWYARILAGGGSILHLARVLVERSVPGGLVTSHREWFREEQAVIAGALDRSEVPAQARRIVGAYRSLYFARVALPKGDLTFGATRLSGAFVSSPHWTLRIAALRLGRRLRRDPRDPVDGWSPPVEVAR